MKKRVLHSLKLAAIVVLCIANTIALFPAVYTNAFSADDLGIAVISDIHYIAPSHCADYSEAVQKWSLAGNHEFLMIDGLLSSAFAAIEEHKEENSIKYLVIPGDLTNNGEYDSHVELAKRLEEFEENTGIPVMVINGNHDINNYSAETFENGFEESARITTPEEYRQIYNNLGYDLATSTYTPPEGEKAGALSYSVVTPEGYRFILLDGGKYSEDSTSDGEASHETGGNYSAGLFSWLLGQIAEAKANGEVPIAVSHWNLVPHYDGHDTMMQDFPVDNWMQVTETITDAGLNFAFSGHSHANDIATHISDNGSIMYDCQTDSLNSHPNTYREVIFSTSGDEVTADYKMYDADCVLPVTDALGKVWDTPFRRSSFTYYYGDSVVEYAMHFVDPIITNLFNEIIEVGGLVKYIGTLGYDLDAIMRQYIGNGIVVDGYYYVTPDNAMAFINDLGSQIDERYIKDVDYTLTTLKGYIEQICNMKVSDYPCTGLLSEYGYGSTTAPGTFGDAVMMTVTGMWGGDEDISDDFMQDVLYRFRNDNLAQEVFNKLYDVIVQQLAQDEILSNLYVNLDTVFTGTPYVIAGDYVQFGLDTLTSLFGGDEAAIGEFLESIFAGYVAGEADSSASVTDVIKPRKTSYLTLVNTVLAALDATGVLEGGDVNGVLAALMDEYITQSQYDAWGETFCVVIEGMASDFDPGFKSDWNCTLVKKADKYDVEVTQDNYRSPSLISVSLGEDSETTRNISWYTKYSVTGSDIELIPYSDAPVFTGYASVPAGVTADVESYRQPRSFPGIDLGILGLLDYELVLNRHIVKLTGLEADTKYLYRVGDAKKGWWSETGIIQTADGSNETTVLNLTDSQSQNMKQYQNWANTLDIALDAYPDADLILHAGDMVDHGDNLNQWKYFFNSATDSLMDIPLMPVAGNHEGKGVNALDYNFVLPKSVTQNTETGYYYSYDYNNVHFIMLNTNDTDDSTGLNEAQLNWIKADAQASRAQWKILVMHKAVYSNGSHYDDGEVVKMRAQLATLMPELGIDVVIQGHDHVYLRTAAMNNNMVVEVQTQQTEYGGKYYTAAVNPDGTYYSIGATSGVKFYKTKDNALTDELFPRAESIVNADAPVFTAIRVVDDTLFYDAYITTGGTATAIDSFSIVKTKPVTEPALRGDVDFDDDVDTDDARLILRASVGLESFTDAMLLAADFTGNGAADTDDARMALRMSVGLEEKLYYDKPVA